ncbi:MAG: hypothetical protein AAF558_01635 [Verrucomicrobiota bacterium]
MLGQGDFVSGTSGIFAVNSGELELLPVVSSTSFVRVNPNSAQLGVADVANLTSPLEVKFDIRLPDLGSNSTILSNFELRDSTIQIFSLQIRNDGRLRAGSTNWNNALTEETSTITAILDFATDTFSLSVEDSVNGVTQLTGNTAFNNVA